MKVEGICLGTPPPESTLRERISWRIRNSLCRMGWHIWSEYFFGAETGRALRMCYHCCGTQYRD